MPDAKCEKISNAGLQTILIAMNTHADNNHVMQQACDMLWKLCETSAPDNGERTFNPYHDMVIEPENDGKFCALGSMLAAMKRKKCVMDPLVQHNACRALASLAVSDRHRDAIVSGGAVPLIFTAMGNFPQDEELQFQSVNAAVQILSYEADMGFDEKNEIASITGLRLLRDSNWRWRQNARLKNISGVALGLLGEPEM
jgi:hypothetical protein